MAATTNSAGNGLFTRMTNDNGQNIDIYENPSEHYAGINTRGSPYLSAIKKMETSMTSDHGFGKKKIQSERKTCFYKK